MSYRKENGQEEYTFQALQVMPVLLETKSIKTSFSLQDPHEVTRLSFFISLHSVRHTPHVVIERRGGGSLSSMQCIMSICLLVKRNVEPMLAYCWPTVYDAGPTLYQH